MRSPPLLLLLAASIPVALAADAPATIEDCDALVQADPDHIDSYTCYGRVAHGQGRADDAIRRLEAHLSVDSDNQFARIALAYLESTRGSERAVSLYREAVDALAQGEPGAVEGNTRLYLADLLAGRGRDEEADLELERARVIAEQIKDPRLETLVVLQQAGRRNRSGELSASEQMLLDLEPRLPAEAPWLRADWAATLGYSLWAQGRHRRALALYREKADILHRLGQPWAEAGARHDIVLLEGTRGAIAGPWNAEARVAAWSEVLELARQAGHRKIQAKAHLGLAAVAWLAGMEPQLIRDHLRAAQELAVDIEDRLAAQHALGRHLALQDPRDVEAGLRLLAQASEEARSVGRPLSIASAWANLALVRRALAEESGWVPELRARALQASWEALDRIEALRDLQPEHLARARVFSQWEAEYSRFAGSLLWPFGESPLPENLEVAFQVMERKRARVLLDELDAARVSAASDLPEAAERGQVLARIAEVQRSLVAAGLTDARRGELLRELDGLELREASLRAGLARADPRFGGLRAPALPALGEVAEALRENEAILSFSIGQDLWPVDHSWVMVHTRRSTATYPVPPREVRDPAIELLVSVLHNRDDGEVAGAVRLYRDLLEPALRDLPPEIDHLIIVPEGSLHRLPFAVLREDAGAPTLGERTRISTVPSITTWLRWRRAEEPEALEAALAVADPDLTELTGSGAEVASLEREAILETVRELGSLPHARREARAITRHLRPSRSLVGPDATEHALKEGAAAGLNLLHVGAHAVVDYARPERSAILLAPGGGDEDGFLQTREIADLDLDGSVVVLSACRSATGQVLAGEGAMSLARGFFVAGARAVIGSLWPLRDDEAAALFEDFYRHLATGDSLAGALAAARRDRVAAGDPAVAWAGVVLLGDGDLVPFPGGVRRGPSRGVLLALGAALVAVTLAALVLLRRRPAARSDSP